MIFFLSLVTSAKDYFEIVHNLIEFHPNYSIIDYNEFGSLISYLVLTIKNFFVEFLTLNWLQNLWSLPILVPDIASAMVSEISVLDGFFHNAFTFLETPLSYGKQNYSIYGLEKFTIGLINSFFLFLPTSTAHIIMLRRFVFQGIEAGYIAGFGIIAGNLLWLASIIFGWRFFIIPWLSLDILRYLLGFVILIKYMWHAVHDERRTNNSQWSKASSFMAFPSKGKGSFRDEAFEVASYLRLLVKMDLAKSKIFLVTFLLALTEQTSLYPFISNLSIGAESTILENFPVENLSQFIFIHFSYLLGIFAGSFSLLNLTCWLWENPIYKIYLWLISNSSSTINLPFNLMSIGGIKTNYYKYLNFIFLYLIMLCTISSIPYFGLDYTLTNPLGFVSDDRLHLINKKTNKSELPETSFLSLQAFDRNTRNSRGRHGRRERWKDRLRKYRGMDTSLYEQSIYDLFTIEDLNFGFDKFWLRRKMKKHYSRFRMVIFRPWLLSLKKQIAKPRITSNYAARVELFQMLFEQFYHPNFHAYLSTNVTNSNKQRNKSNLSLNSLSLLPSKLKVEGLEEPFVFEDNKNSNFSKNLESKNLSNALTKLNNQLSEQKNNTYPIQKRGVRQRASFSNSGANYKKLATNVRKENKLILTTSALRKFVRKINTRVKSAEILSHTFTNMNKSLYSKYSPSLKVFSQVPNFTSQININLNQVNNKISNLQIGVSRQSLRYKTLLKNSKIKNKSNLLNLSFSNPKIMLHPIKFYLQKEKALRRKWKSFYGTNIYRKFSIENNAPYFKVMMNRLFYYYKPTLRYIKTLKLAKNEGGKQKRRRQKSRTPLIYQPSEKATLVANAANAAKAPLAMVRKEEPKSNQNSLLTTYIKSPTHNYRIVGKNASRYRFEIYRQALLNWYYTPFNRLLLKFDIDSFIRRQPNSHFLTKKEEQELHLKRFLLSEHYDTLRWYTSMQHYRSMKTNIGGTKSFASKIYNHQFQGTFKKLRHLFAITPTNSNQLSSTLQDKTELLNTKQILKFDQPLYNEYSNTQLNSIIKDSVMHEELNHKLNRFNSPSASNFKRDSSLLPPDASFFKERAKSEEGGGEEEATLTPLRGVGVAIELHNNGEDLMTQSISIVKEFFKTSEEKRQENIKIFLRKNNYTEFTAALTGKSFAPLLRFFFSPDPPPPSDFAPTMHSKSGWSAILFPQFNLDPLKPEAGEAEKNKVIKTEGSKDFNATTKMAYEGRSINQMSEANLWFSFLKNSKKGLYDQQFLVKYLERRTKKNERRQQKKKYELKKRLKRLKVWLAPNPLGEVILETKNTPVDKTPESESARSFFVEHGNLTTGVKKAIKDGLLNLKPTASIKATKNSKLVYANPKSIIEKEKIKTITKPDSTPSDSLQISALSLIKLNNEKELKKKKNIFNAAQTLVYTTLLKTKIISFNIMIELKNILSSPYRKTKQILAKKTIFKTLIHKDPILTWNIKELTLKKRKRSRKKYTKEIRKAISPLNKKIKTVSEGQAALKSKLVSALKPNLTLESESELEFESESELELEKAFLTNQVKEDFLANVYKGNVYKGNLDYLKMTKQGTAAKNSEKLKNVRAFSSDSKSGYFHLKKARFFKFKGWPPILRRSISQSEKRRHLKLRKRFNRPIERRQRKRYRAFNLMPAKIENTRKIVFPNLANNFSSSSFKLLTQPNIILNNYSIKRSLKTKPVNISKETNFSISRYSQRSPLLEEEMKATLKSASDFDSDSGVEMKTKKKISNASIPSRKKSASEEKDVSTFNLTQNSFLYVDTLYGKKFELLQNFRKIEIQNRRNQYFERARMKVEAPSLNANLDRKQAAMVQKNRLEILKEQVELNYVTGAAFNQNLNSYYDNIQKFTNVSTADLKRKSKKRNVKHRFKHAINILKLRKTRTQKKEFIRPQHTKILTKQIKRIKLNLKFQEWWWNQFLPNISVTAQKNSQLERERQFQKIIAKLSKTKILERDALANLNSSKRSPELQISNYDLKPLDSGVQNSSLFNFNKHEPPIEVVPSAIHIESAGSRFMAKEVNASLIEQPNPPSIATPSLIGKNQNQNQKGGASSFGQKQALLIEENTQKSEKTNKQFIVPTNPIPFYAGWDESLRKLVVTNRLLSRREAGYSINSNLSSYHPHPPSDFLKNQKGGDNQNQKGGEGDKGAKLLHFSSIDKKENTKHNLTNQNKIEFTNFPLQGMNAGTTLYCQVPFTTFNPDQLFSKGMDGYAPIGWRRFDFTHTILKTQSFFSSNHKVPLLNQRNANQKIVNLSNLKSFVIQKNLISKLDQKTNKINLKKPFSNYADFETIKTYSNYSRRLNKHYKRMKKQMISRGAGPSFIISGPLISEVLPIHYVNIFYNQNRLSPDRYLKRRFRRGKKGVPGAIKQQKAKKAKSNNFIHASLNKSDFTLRRRLKTRRKYHRKYSRTKGVETRPRRHKFYTEFNTQMALNNTPIEENTANINQISKKIFRKRPSKRKPKKNRNYDGSLTTKARQRQKIQKTSALKARLRQLKRRVSRQVLKPSMRFRPRAGGFLWPGDYLRLEQTELPKLNLDNKQNLSKTISTEIKLENKQKIKRKIKKKSILKNLFVQPRKYLLEKHNIKVIKKKLEKALRLY